MHRLLARISPLALVAASLSALSVSPAIAAAPTPASLHLQGDAIGDSDVAAQLGLLFADAFDQALPDACDVAAGMQGYGVAVDSTKFCFNPSSTVFVPDLSLDGLCRAILAPVGASLVDTAVSRTSAWTLDTAGVAHGCVYPSGTAGNFKGWAAAYKSALLAYRKQGFDAMQSAVAACDDSLLVNACMVKDVSGQWVPDPAIFKPLSPPPMPTQANAVSVTIANVASMSAGAYAQVFVKTDGSVVARCDSTLPTGPTSVCSVPSSLGTAPRVAAARQHVVALKADGSVAEWGSVLLNGTATAARAPALTNVVDVAAGDDFALALLADGSVAAWGDGSVGQTAVPSGLSQVKQIAAGRCHAVVLHEDGTVSAWGCSAAGQTAVASLSGVVAIDASGDSTVVWFADGRSHIVGATDVIAQPLTGTATIAGASGAYFTSGNDCQVSASEYAANDAGTATSISAPSSLSVAVAPSDAQSWRFTWNPPANAATKPGYTYEARYSATNGRTWSDWVAVTSPVDYAKPANGVVARFDVRAVYKSVAGSWMPGPKAHMVVQETTICGGNQSSSVSAMLQRTEGVAPTAPAAVTAVSATSKTLRVGFAAAPFTGVGTSVVDPVTYTVRYSLNGYTWLNAATRGFGALITGLTGGTSYQVQVVAANRFGSATTTIAAKTVADAVVSSVWTTSVGGRSVALAWKAGVFPVGSKDKVTDYKIEHSADGIAWTAVTHKAATKTSITVSGLKAATEYQFRVSAVSTSGTGAPTAPLAVTTTTAVPMPATALALTARTSTSITATWQAPVDTGGLPVTSYSITTSPAGGVAVIDGTTAVISNLATGKAVTVSVVARNSLGASTSVSAKTTVIGQAGAPTATVQRLATSVAVTWKAPSNTGGSKITGYVVTRQPDGVPMVVSGMKTTLSGLTRGDKVTVTITAVTAFGLGQPVTLVVSPMDVPAAPASVTYVSKDAANWSVGWTAPTDTGGSVIKGYRVSISRDGGTTWSSPTTVTKSPYVMAKYNGLSRIVKVWAYNAIGDGAPITLTVTN